MPDKALRVLILDDSDTERNRFVQEFTNIRGQAESSSVRVVASGAGSIEEAIRQIGDSHEEPPSYVLVDQYNRKQNDIEWGFKATDALRKEKRDILAIIFSNIALNISTELESFQTRAFQSGAVRYLAKPGGQKELLGIVSFLKTMRELSGLKEALERQSQTQKELSTLSLAINAGLLILDKEEIVWYVNDEFSCLISRDPQGKYDNGNDHPLPWKLQQGSISSKSRWIIRQIFGEKDSMNLKEDWVFAVSRSNPERGSFLHVQFAPLRGSDGEIFAVQETITELPEAILGTIPLTKRADLVLEALGDHGFSRARAYRINYETKKAAAFATLGDLGDIPKEEFINHEYRGSGDQYIQEVINLRAPQVFYAPKYPSSPTDLSGRLKDKWPIVVAPLMIGDIGMGGLLVEVDETKARQFEITGRFPGIEEFLSPLSQLLVRPTPTPDINRKQWIEERNKLTHTLMRLNKFSNIYDEITRVLVTISGAKMGHLRISEGENLVIKGTCGILGQAMKNTPRKSLPQNHNVALSSQTYRTCMSLYRRNMNTEANYDEEYEHFVNSWTQDEIQIYRNCHSIAIIPLIFENTCYGILSLYSPEMDFFTEEKQRFLSEAAKDSASIVYSVVVAQENLEAHQISQTLQRSNLFQIVARLLTIHDEEELLWWFAIGMTHGEVVGFNRILLFRLMADGESNRIEILFGTGPCNTEEGAKFRIASELGGVKIDLEASLNQWNHHGGHIPDSPLMDYLKRVEKTRSFFEDCPISKDCPTLGNCPIICFSSDDTAFLDNQLPIALGKCRAKVYNSCLGEMLRILETNDLYCFRVPTEDRDRFIVGLCDFVYLDKPNLQTAHELGRELVEHLAMTYRHRREQREAQLQVGKRLVGRASHRLSSLIPPMMDQINLAQKCLENNDHPGAEKWMDILRFGASDSNEFLKELTEFAKLEIVLNERLDSSSLFQWIQQELTNRFPHVPIVFASLDSSEGGQVQVDQRKLLAAFIELIQDSIKYAHSPKLAVKLCAHLKENQLLITYEDNGRGITSSIRQSLFLPFTTEAHFEVGLGLSIVRYTIERHFGSIAELGDLDSRRLPFPRSYPSGVYFVIQLPIEKEIAS